MLSGPVSSWERPGSAPADVAGRPMAARSPSAGWCTTAPKWHTGCPNCGQSPSPSVPKVGCPMHPAMSNPPPFARCLRWRQPALHRVRTRDVREIRVAIVCLAQRTDLEPLNRHIGNRRGGQRTGRRCTRPGDGRAVGQRVTTLTPPGERRLQLIAHPPGSVVTRVIRPAWAGSWNHVHGVSSMHSRISVNS